MEQLILIMRQLRDPENGCPWDLEQTFATIAPHTLEEVYEVVDAIENGDLKHLREELGDLLFQVVFYARLGEEQGEFDFDGIADAISAKLLRRHPHVFPDGTLESAGKQADITSSDVVSNWEAIKAEERAGRTDTRGSALDDVPTALPALMRAVKLQKRAARSGFDWQNSQQVMAKLHEEINELETALAESDADAIEEELADVLFSVVNVSRHLGLDPETLLRQGNRKFEARFRHMEVIAEQQGSTFSKLGPDDQETLWQLSKKALDSGS